MLAYRLLVDAVFRALADPTRRLILDELTARNDQTLFELCTALTMKHAVSMSRQAISQHLAVLEDAGLIATERRGRTKLHRFDPAPLAEIPRRWPGHADRTQTDQERTDP
jgi:DNA-binding transcriptional ArsR family regulator